MKKLIVKLNSKYKEAVEEKWVKTRTFNYERFFGGKTPLCKDHFRAPSGCQPSCPFSKFSHKKAGSGCAAWLIQLAEQHGAKLYPPFPQDLDYPKVFQVLAKEAKEHIEWKES